MVACEPPKRKRQKRLDEVEDMNGDYTLLSHPNVVTVNAQEHYNGRVLGHDKFTRMRFGAQDPALDHLRTQCDGAGVVMASDKVRGDPKKVYYVMSLREHFARMKRMHPRERCFYEINPTTIHPERGLAAVHMHLDVEIYFDTNPQFATIAEYNMVEHVYTGELLSFMRTFLGLAQEPDRVQLMPICDSSVEGKKISRHYVFRVQGAMFYDGTHCGALLRHFENHIIAKYGHPTDESNGWYFWVEKEKIRHDPPDPWFDKRFWLDWIYSRHRLFRCYMSSKKGQDRWLKLLHNPTEEVREQDVSHTSILWPEEPTSSDARLILIKVPEPDGSDARSQTHRYNHRIVRNPNDIAVTSNGRMIDVSRRPTMAITSSAADPVVSNEDELPQPLGWVGHGWNDRSGRSKKPRFCMDLGKDMVAIVNAELRAWYAMSKSLNVRFSTKCPTVEPCYYDFSCRNRLEFRFQTKGGYCPFLREEGVDSKGAEPIRLHHSNNNTIIEVDLEALTYTWSCYNHSGKRLASEPLPKAIIDTYGATIAEFVSTFRRDNSIDVADILRSLLRIADE